MMRNQTPSEIHIALNVLAEMKETNPFLHRKFRRLLPALAMDFARAGRPVSERILKDVLKDASLFGRPIESLFNQPRPGWQRTRRYQDVAARLNERLHPDAVIDIDDAVGFGMTHAVIEQIGTHPRRDAVDKYLWHAAQCGHYELTRFLIDTAVDKSYLISRALQAAMVSATPQYHIIAGIVRDDGDEYEDVINTACQLHMNADKRSLYDAYTLLKTRHQVSGNYPDDAFTGLERWQHTGVRMGDYIRIRDMLAYEEFNVAIRNKSAYKAALVLLTSDRVLHYLERWGKPGEKPLSTLIKNLQAPIAQAGIDWKAWGDALLKYGPEIGYMTHFAQQVRAPVCNSKGQISLRLTREYIQKNCFPLRHRNEALADLVFSLERNNDVFEKALAIWDQRFTGDYEQPGHLSIPDIRIDGAKIGLPGYTLMRMPYDDLRIMFMGDYTGCCERVGDHFEDTVEHALETGESGYYVLMKGDDIRLHSWVWRGEGGQLIIDGYESKDPHIKKGHMINLTKQIAETLAGPLYEEYEVTDVILGLCGERLDISKHFPAAQEIATRFACEWYFPEINQWLVKRIAAPTDFTLLSIDDTPAKPAASAPALRR